MEKLKTYLVGSIQDARDGGVNWRDKVTKSLFDLGFEVQDPTKFECNHSLAPTIDEQKKKLENLKRSGSWEIWDKVMSEIRQADLVCVNNSKFLVVLYDPNKKLGGTIHEVVEAWQKGVPMYVVSYSPFIEFNDWILALFRDNVKRGGKLFPNFKQLVEFIETEHKDYIKDYRKFTKEQEKISESGGAEAPKVGT